MSRRDLPITPRRPPLTWCESSHVAFLFGETMGYSEDLYPRPRREFIAWLVEREEYTHDGITYIRSTLRHCYRGGVFSGVLWSIVKREHVNRDGLVLFSTTSIHCDLCTCRGGKWGYRPLTEQVHPFYYSCPLSYLTIAKDNVCEEWRAKVRYYHSAECKLERKLQRCRIGAL